MTASRRRTSLLWVFALIVGLMPMTVAFPALAEDNPGTTVFINELHYDNVGTDQGEFVEVAGPAGTDLAGWSIVLYNGANGSVYNSTALAGNIPDEGGGYGTVVIHYPSNGIQNGDPDGVALVDDSGAIIQFLSYGGVFVGVGGPADGVTSTDIGIAEGSTTPIGQSLQLQGSGLAYGDFTWQAGSASPGVVNATQTFGTPPPPFINELHYDNVGTDEGEFVEVAGRAGTDITGWSIVLYNGANGAAYDTRVLAGTIPDEGSGYGAVVVTYPSNGIQNGSPDGVALVDDNGDLVQFLSYEGVFTAITGPAAGVTSIDIGIAQEPAPPVGLSLQLEGPGFSYADFTWTSGAQSPGCLNAGQTDIAASCGDPEPAAGLVISQVYGGGGNSGAELTHDFVEIFNPTDSAVDVTGWSVQYASSGNFSWNVTALSGVIEPGEYYLVQQAAGTGGTTPLPAPDATGNAAMAAGSGKVALAPTASAVGADCESALAGAVDFVGYGTAANCFEGSAPTATLNNTTAALRLEGGCVDTDDNAADFETAGPAPRNSASPVGDCDGPPPVGNCPAPPEVAPIGAVQGAGETSPCVGEMVVIEGVVVGDYEGPAPALRGFYLQSADGGHDDDESTSEGIFVFHGDEDLVDLGDLVRVRGVVAEFQGQTQINFPDSLVHLAANQTVTPVQATMPFPSHDYLERYEGMLVEFDQALYVTEFFQLGRFGQIVVSSDDRLAQPTNVVAPGAEAVALQAANDLNRLIIDDHENGQNPDPILFGRGGDQLTAANTLRGGDTVTGAVGVMTYTWGGNAASPNAYRLRVVNDLSDSGLVAGGLVPEFQAANPRPTDRPEIGGSLTVASFNVLNYFLTIDAGGNQCGPVGFEQGCRGANSSDELTRQRTKLLAALVKLDVDVLALMELENTPGVEPVADLVAGLNGIAGAGTYSFVDTGVIGTDVIRTGLIYRTGAVAEAGSFAILDSSVDPRFDDDLNRPTLAQSFRDVVTGETFTVAVNHLKSKGSCPTSGPDADQGDGQGCWTAARVAAAEAMVEWLASHPTGVVDDDVLITGDLNSYAKEDPIAVFTDAGYVDLHSHFDGPDAYGYVFDGQWGYLDHALASAELFAQVAGAESYHINADEPSVLDYNVDFKTANQIAILFAPDEFRTSDHDPIVIGLDMVAPLPVWSPTQIYNTGDRVIHNGKIYEALWWTQNQVPGASPTGPWQEMAETADGTAIWTPSRIFDAGDRVSHQGKIYEALWWTRNQEPGNPTGPWQEMEETTDGIPIWTPSRVFNAGDVVFHNGNLYVAQWWNRNVVPTGTGAWRLFN